MVFYRIGVAMLVNLSEVMSNVGKRKDTQLPITLEQFTMYGEEYNFSKKEDAQISIVCIGERKISLSCKAELSLEIPCSRCLEMVQVPFTIDFEKEFDFTGEKEEAREALEEAEYIQEYSLDVDALVVQEMMLQFPMQTLCSEDCKGICDVCGTNLNTGSCDCAQQGRDPRMLAIQDIFKNFGQTDN